MAHYTENASTLKSLGNQQLNAMLSLELGSEVEDRIRQSLLNPVSDLLGRPKKNLRSLLAEVGMLLGSEQARPNLSADQAKLVIEVIEALHAGSLVVDDIEDGSAFRRGEPSLHERYGVPVALNAGNWLYFWPLELIYRMNLRAEKELEIYRLYHRTLLRAHFGQALDVGTPIDKLPRQKVHATCMASLELKSGSLASFGVGLGALVAGAESDTLQALVRFGHRVGVALQMLDDLGNFLGKKDPFKKWEDLRLRRPTWIWACLAGHENFNAWSTFLPAVDSLPDERALETWMVVNSSLISECKDQALGFLDDTIADLHGRFRSSLAAEPAFALVGSVKERLVTAYG